MTEIERLQRIAKLRNLVAAAEVELTRLGTTPKPTRQKPKRQPAKCGTDGGYYRHIRTTKTPPCDDCLAAHREYERGRARRQMERAA